MAAKRKKAKACKIGGRDCNDFVKYLEGTLIPDLEDAGGSSAIVADFRLAISFLRGQKRGKIGRVMYDPTTLAEFFRDTVAPDLEKAGRGEMARDYIEAADLLDQL